MTIVYIIIGLIVLREILAVIFRWGADEGDDDTWLEIRRHNRNLYKTGQADRNEVRMTTVGWRRDPWHREDGQTKSTTRRGSNDEYYRIVRKR